MYFKNILLWTSGILLSSALIIACDQTFKMPQKKNYTVAITQYADTVVLNAAYLGIMEGLKEKGYNEGKNLKIIYMNAYADSNAADKIAEDFVKLKPDLIISISTPSTKAVVKANQQAQIPLVFSTVTDPVFANIVPSLAHTGGHVTGVYDLPPVGEQAVLIQELLPSLKTIGVVYNPNEVNAVRMFEQFKQLATSFKILTAKATSVKAVEGAVNSLVGKVDAFYIMQDNTVQSASDTVLKISMDNRIPVFASDHGLVEQGALAAISDNQYDVGYLAGRMAASVLDGKDPGQMDVVRISFSSLYINLETAKKLNITIPEKLKNKAIIY